MCGLRSEIERPSLIQLLRALFRREPSQREGAEVVLLPETASAWHTLAEEAEKKRRSEAA